MMNFSSYESCMYLKFDGELIFIDPDGEEFLVKGLYTIQQYSGFSDKNNVDIFEGDIVKVWDEFISTHIITQVYWIGGSIMIHDSEYTDRCNFRGYPVDCEVIGNIFETPGLLVKH